MTRSDFSRNGSRWARLAKSTYPAGWALTCDLCRLRETYREFWRANHSLLQHVGMHNEDWEEQGESET